MKQVFVHFLVYDPNGPIKTSTTNLRVACTPDSKMPYAATPTAMKRVITCPLCLQTEEFKELCEDDKGSSSADDAAMAYSKKGQ